eukprot:scaffold16245_cov67-Phaeocystis_antarctica.AAC.7
MRVARFSVAHTFSRREQQRARAARAHAHRDAPVELRRWHAAIDAGEVELVVGALRLRDGGDVGLDHRPARQPARAVPALITTIITTTITTTTSRRLRCLRCRRCCRRRHLGVLIIRASIPPPRPRPRETGPTACRDGRRGRLHIPGDHGHAALQQRGARGLTRLGRRQVGALPPLGQRVHHRGRVRGRAVRGRVRIRARRGVDVRDKPLLCARRRGRARVLADARDAHLPGGAAEEAVAHERRVAGAVLAPHVTVLRPLGVGPHARRRMQRARRGGAGRERVGSVGRVGRAECGRVDREHLAEGVARPGRCGGLRGREREGAHLGGGREGVGPGGALCVRAHRPPRHPGGPCGEQHDAEEGEARGARRGQRRLRHARRAIVAAGLGRHPAGVEAAKARCEEGIGEAAQRERRGSAERVADGAERGRKRG